MPTLRHRRAQQRNRLTPEVVMALMEGCTGVELGMLLQLRRNETFGSVVPPIARAALDATPERLEAWLGHPLPRGGRALLEQWAGVANKPPPLEES